MRLCPQTLASSSASSRFSLISASVLTKRVHSSALGTQICCAETTVLKLLPKDQPNRLRGRTHLADVKDLHLALRVPGGDLLASVGPSDAVQRRRSVHKHTGSGNLRHDRERPVKSVHIYLFCKCLRQKKLKLFLSAPSCPDNNNQPLDLNSLRLPLCRCSGSTGRGVRRGPRRQTAPGVLETTWNRRRNHSCPRRSTAGGCSAERESHFVSDVEKSRPL